MVVYREDMVQRPLNFCIVDEVDSILIDEARTPLIIPGQSSGTTLLYTRTDRFAKTLEKDTDFKIDLESKTVSLTEQGIRKGEQYFGTQNLFDRQYGIEPPLGQCAESKLHHDSRQGLCC